MHDMPFLNTLRTVTNQTIEMKKMQLSSSARNLLSIQYANWVSHRDRAIEKKEIKQ